MPTDKEIKDIAESAANFIMNGLHNEDFERDYLIACITEAIENSKLNTEK